MRRRDLLAIGAVFAIAIAIPPYLRRRAPAFDLVGLEGFPGFRRRSGLAMNGNSALFTGLDEPPATEYLDSASLCRILFGDEGWSSDPLPVSVFSDYYCPFCAVLDKRLATMREAGLPIRLIFHELPLLGPRSRWAAQVALAAGRQMPHDVIHLDLMQRGVKPGMAGLREVASRHGLDLAQLQKDAEGPDVRQQIDSTLGFGRALGIIGTPGSFIGRTLFMGTLTEAEIAAMVAEEATLPFTACK